MMTIFISPGDTYELFCHAGTEGWKSLGKQRADTTCLDWIVPDNAIVLVTRSDPWA